MSLSLEFDTDSFPPPARQRVLVSADAHGGAPAAELDKVLARSGRDAAPRVIGPGDSQRKEPVVHPEDRIGDQQTDGVSAEVIYSRTGFVVDEESFEDALVRIQAKNDWSAETYSGHLNRFAPSVELPLPIEGYGKKVGKIVVEPRHIEAAADEIRRCKELGLRPALLPDHLPGFGYNKPEWDPIWETACEVGMPLAFHVGIGHSPVQVGGPGGAITNYTLVTSQIIETLAHLAAGGVLERHPELRCVLVECGSGWLAWAMGIMDEAHVKHAHWAKPKLPMPPSEYVKRQIQVTFQYDPVGIANRHFTGLRCLMWGADYPHHEGTFPNSQGVVARLFEGVPEDEIDQIVRRNACETFGFDV